MLANLGLIAIGLVALYYGAEWLVKGASRLAGSFGVPPLLIGLTLVAFGTSTPEMLVSVTAALSGVSDIALGNVVGSNIANVGLILGLTGILFPIAIQSRVLKREIPLMLIASLFAYVLAWNGMLSRVDGVLLFAGIVAFTVFSYRLGEETTETPEVQKEMEGYEAHEGIAEGEGTKRGLEFGRMVLGIALLTLGAQWLVSGASTLARAVGISDWIIGLTLVAIGTSLPELATSLVSAFRHEDDISVGNIVGSNIFNLLAVLGVTAMVRPVPVEASMLRVELPIMLAFSLILMPLLADGKLARWQGALLLGGYVAFTLFLFL